jgi:RimJ/RimL family protein N-acetyltransferase
MAFWAFMFLLLLNLYQCDLFPISPSIPSAITLDCTIMFHHICHFKTSIIFKGKKKGFINVIVKIYKFVPATSNIIMAIQFLDLKKLRQEKSPLVNKTLEWIRTLTIEQDFENGSSFTRFVESNLELDYPYTVFILFDSSHNEVVGIASIIPDDQDVGKEFNLEGIWIGGVNIRREYRGAGYGKILFKNIDDYLNSIEKPFRANLFVNNPIALKIYEKYGYIPTGLKIVRHGQESVVCTKFYR